MRDQKQCKYFRVVSSPSHPPAPPPSPSSSAPTLLHHFSSPPLRLAQLVALDHSLKRRCRNSIGAEMIDATIVSRLYKKKCGNTFQLIFNVKKKERKIEKKKKKRMKKEKKRGDQMKDKRPSKQTEIVDMFGDLPSSPPPPPPPHLL